MKAVFLILFILFIKILITEAKDCVINNRTPENAWETKLHKDIKCKYKNISSIKTVKLNITLRFVLKSFEFDALEEVFSIYAWVFLSWNDKRLTWDPTQYNGLTESKVSSLEYSWTPNFKLINSANPSGGFMDFIFCMCDVTYTGSVVCVPRLQFDAICSTNLRHWPYDAQNCSFKFGNSKLSGYHIEYHFAKNHPITLFGAENDNGWWIMDYKLTENQHFDEPLVVSFRLERVSTGLAASIVVPSVVVTVLTMSSLFLDVKDNIRLGMLCFSVLGHFTFMTQINEEIPKHGDNTPLILLFLRSSLVTTAIVIILTLILHHLRKLEVQTPLWIGNVNDYVFKSRGKILIYPRWEVYVNNLTVSQNLETNDSTKKEWTDFANVINSIFLILILLVYICLFLFCMPEIKTNM